MEKNRLEIILSAKTDEFSRGLKKAELDAKDSSKKIVDALEESGSGAEALNDAIDKVDFDKLEKDAAKSSKKVIDALEDISEVFDEIVDSIDHFDDALGDVDFDFADKLRSELVKVEKTAKKTGDDLKKSFTEAGKGGEQLTKKIEELKKPLDSIEKTAKKPFETLKKSVSEARDEVSALERSLQLEGLANVASRVSEIGKGVGDFFSGAAQDARKIDQEIKKAFGNPAEAAKFSSIIGNIKAEFGDLANSDGLIQATKTLETFGLANEKELKRVINIAEATGKSYQEIAEKQGQFFAAASSGSVKIEVLEEYRKTLGVGAKDLEKFGAKVDENNKLLGRTPQEIEAAQKALNQYLDTNERFAGVLERAQTGQDKLAAATGFLNESIGVQVESFKDAIAEGILPMVEGLNNLSDGTKRNIGLTIAGGSALAEYGGKAVELAAFAKIAGFSVKGMGAGMLKAAGAAKALALGTAGMAAGFTVAIGLAALIAKSIDDYNKALISAEEAEQALIATQSRANIANKDRIASINKSVEAIRAETDAIKDQAKQRETITKDILLKEGAADDARRSGATDRAKLLDEEAAKLKGVRAEYDTQTAAVVASEKKKEEAQKQTFINAEKAFDAFKEKLSGGLFDSDAAALRDLNQIAANLSGPKLKEAMAERKKLQQTVLADEISTLKKSVAARDKSVEDSEAAFKGLVTKYQANTQQRKALEEDFSNFLQGEIDKRLAAESALQQQKIQLQQQSISIQKQASDGELNALQTRLAAGEKVQDQIKAELSNRTKVLKSLIDEEAALARISIQRERDEAAKADPANANTIAEIAAERERQLNIVTAQQKSDLDRKLTDDRLKLEREIVKAQEEAAKKKQEAAKKEADQAIALTELTRQRYELEQSQARELFDLRQKAIDEEEARGGNVGQKRIDLEKELQAFEKAGAQKRLDQITIEINAKRDAANIGATPAEKALNNERAKLEILKEQQNARQTLAGLEDASVAKAKTELDILIQQRDALKSQNDERQKASGFSIDTSFGASDSAVSFGEGFGQMRKPKGAVGPTEQELDREIARKRIELTKTRESSSTPSELTRSINEASRGLPATDPALIALNQQQVSSIDRVGQKIDSLTAAITQSNQQSLQQPKNWADGWSRGTGNTMIS